jgi:cell division septum initiation protein DivIVA
MSVSAPQNPGDYLDAVVNGGDAFLARVKALKEVRAEHDEALANLRLGHDVVRAMQDVQRREQAVIDTTETAKAEAEKIIADAKATAESLVAEATDNAVQLIAKAQAEADKLSAEVDEAHAELGKWSDKIKSDVLRMASVREASTRVQEAFMNLHDLVVAVTEGRP